MDAWASWRPWPVLELAAGYSVFVVEDGAQRALSPIPPNDITTGAAPQTSAPYTASLSHFAYLQATLRVP